LITKHVGCLSHAVRTPSDAEENFSLLAVIGIAPAEYRISRVSIPTINSDRKKLNDYE